GPGTFFGFGGSVALTILMIPIVVRSSEEMLKLVPADLREASYALGVPKWRTILKVVVPTAMAGIITGITLAVARVIGETAPLVIAAGVTDSINTNLFSGQMTSLPVFVYNSYSNPGSEVDVAVQMAWGAALVLIIIVMGLNILARVLGKLLSPKTGH
ncbi:MAG: ABC transporter permease subunit, partial [Rhodococcus sp. (in: high G+C Gram-positive bacteria)]